MNHLCLLNLFMINFHLNYLFISSTKYLHCEVQFIWTSMEANQDITNFDESLRQKNSKQIDFQMREFYRLFLYLSLIFFLWIYSIDLRDQLNVTDYINNFRKGNILDTLLISKYFMFQITLAFTMKMCCLGIT